MNAKNHEHGRVTLQQAAILNKYFGFEEPCTCSVPCYKDKITKGKGKRVNFMLQVPTISHATDFLVRKGYYASVDTFDNDFSSLVFTEFKLVV